MSIGSKKVSQICIVVNDIQEAERKWNQILGFPARKLKTPIFKLVPSFTDKNPDTFNDSIEFLVYDLDDNCLIEIFPPGEGDTPWRRFLEKHGEGVMNLGFFVPDRQKAYQEISSVCKPTGPYHVGYYPSTTYTFVDTMDDLGTELNIKSEEDNHSLIKKLTADPQTFNE